MRINYQLFVTFFLAISVVGCGDQEGRQTPPAKDCGIGQNPACRVGFRALAATPVYSMGNRYAWKAISELVEGSLY